MENTNIIRKLNKTNKDTLTYLTNPSYYNNVSSDTVSLLNRKYKNSDIKFYRKRIISITKDMLQGKFENNNIKSIYYNYIDSIIEYFVTSDEVDILQEDYIDISINNTINIIDNNLDNLDNLLIKELPIINNTLDNFVIRNNKVEETQFIPQKKIIDLKSISLKTKGIKKK
jgi:hypothetical protein